MNFNVSILVLVDVGLRHCAIDRQCRWLFTVSILVLVDVGLRPALMRTVTGRTLSFNPCFSGCWSSTRHTVFVTASGRNVSILVLVDVGLRLPVQRMTRLAQKVSILVLVDVGLRLNL